MSEGIVVRAATAGDAPALAALSTELGYPTDAGQIAERLRGEILEREWHGGANLEAFAEYLRGQGVVLKGLTTGMLGDSSKVVVRGQEIILAEVSRA